MCMIFFSYSTGAHSYFVIQLNCFHFDSRDDGRDGTSTAIFL
jgi:hypothetical protein